MINLTDLIKGATRGGLLAKTVELLRRKEFPVFGWQSGNPWRTLVEIVVEISGDTLRVIQLIGTGGFLDYADGPTTPEGFGWIDLLLPQLYDTDRKPATFAVHELVFADPLGVGPVDVVAQQIIALGPGGLEFFAIETKTIPEGGQQTVRFQARSPGAEYNVAAGSITRLGTDMPGIVVSNPAIGTTGTSLVAAGLDRETPAEARVRARARWARLGTGTTPDAYRSVLLESANDVRRVVVLENTPTPGKVTAYVAAPSGPAPAPAYASAVAAVEKMRPACIQVFVYNANPQSVPVVGTVFCATGQTEKAEGEVTKRLLAYQARLQLGERLVHAQLVEEIMAPDGVNNVVLTHPVGDVTPAFGHVVVLQFFLTFVEGT